MGFKDLKFSEKELELEKKMIELENSIMGVVLDSSVFFGQDDCVVEKAAKSLGSVGEFVDSQIEQEEEKLRAFAQTFHHNVRALAKFYMQQFFNDKTMYCGGKIPKVVLLIEKRISIVINYDISKGVLKAYEALSSVIKNEIPKTTGEATSDIKLVNETLNLLAQSGVPQQFAGGMLLLYLEFVEGIEIGT